MKKKICDCIIGVAVLVSFLPGIAFGGEIKGETHDLLMQFAKFTPEYVIAAGLADGINPCAIATLIFFISFLKFAGKSRREVIIVGAIFTLTVFTTYFFFMFGVAMALHQLEFYHTASKVISAAAALMAFVLGTISLRDAVVYERSRDASRVKLQLPMTLKRRIHKTITGHVKSEHLVLGSITIGFLVTVFETACSAQMAFPTIVRILQEPDIHEISWKLRALVYLLIYNICFVLPLIVVFLMVFFGMSSQKLAEFSRRHFAFTKVLMTIVLFWLGVTILLTGVLPELLSS